MLSYRKSQQVLLAEKLKKKNVIHAFGVSGSGITMARLCHSAFARVATSTFNLRRQESILCLSAFARVATCTPHIHYLRLPFATAHSRGLRRTQTTAPCTWAFFASAHSRGLRPAVVVNIHACDDLCYSAFARVATMDKVLYIFRGNFATAHSCGLRRKRNMHSA